jgi:hypothetical protein
MSDGVRKRIRFISVLFDWDPPPPEDISIKTTISQRDDCFLPVDDADGCYDRLTGGC